MKIGMVLEGGGMRGIYTIGVLDVLMENNIKVDYVVGVSAGACNGISYVSEQPGRSYRINTSYIEDKRYCSFSNYIKNKSLFGMDFLFDEIPHKLDKFDYDTLLSSSCEFVVGVTDVLTGKPVYFGKEDMKGHSTVLRASSAIPIFSPIVEYKGGEYLDGGTSDPIPVKKAIEDGCDKVIVVLTQHRGFTKLPQKFQGLYKRIFRKYPEMVRVLDQRHEVYNNTTQYLTELEKDENIIVIAPSSPINIGRFEKKKENLDEVYNMGKKDTEAVLKGIEDMIAR